MAGTGGHIKLCGAEYHLCAAICLGAGKLWKADVKAYHNSHFAEAGVKNGDLISRGKAVGLFKSDAALDVNIKKVHLSVFCYLLSVLIKHKAGVIQHLSAPFRHRAADKYNSVFLCPARHCICSLAVLGVGKRVEILF